MENYPAGYWYIKRDDGVLLVKGVDSKEKVEEWVKALSFCTNVTWRVARSYPLKRSGTVYSFKKNYRCQHRTYKGTHTRCSKDTNCRAEMKIKVKCRPDVDLYPCEVYFIGSHNHSLTSAEALRHRDICQTTKNAYAELFRMGHSVATAYTTYLTNKIEEFGDDYPTRSSDRAIFPTKDEVYGLWKREFISPYRSLSDASILDSLPSRLNELREKGHKAEFVAVGSSAYAVCLVTPLMQRSHTVSSAKEIMFVCAMSNCDLQNHIVYDFVTYSGGFGGLPLGCIITNTAEKDAFEAGLKKLAESLDVFTFSPAVIMTDNDLSERKMLQQFFPTSRLLLCTVHVLKDCWNWLLKEYHGVKKDFRQSYYYAFKQMLYAETLEEFWEKHESLKQFCKHFQFLQYVEDLMLQQEEWAMCYRKSLLTRNNETNNGLEIIFRLLKNILFQRLKAANILQLVDFVAVAFESYYIQILLDTAHGKLNSTPIKISCPSAKNLENVGELIQSTHNLYHIKSDTVNATYTVDMSIGSCTCTLGSLGRICKHQVAVIEKFDLFSAANSLSLEAKQKLFWIATTKIMPVEYFEPMQTLIISEISSGADNLVQSVDIPYIVLNEDLSSGSTQDVQNIDIPYIVVTDDLSSESTQDEAVHMEDINKEVDDVLTKIQNRLKKEACDDPTNVLPALKKMLQNLDNVKAQSSFISGACCAFSSSAPKHLVSLRKEEKITVQPAASSHCRLLGEKRLYENIGGLPKKIHKNA